MTDYVSAKRVREHFGITSQTLHNWRNNGQIKFHKINSNKFVYDLSSVLNESNSVPRFNIIYSRVSNTKQKDDLIRQSSILREFVTRNGFVCDHEFQDIASGMNENRKGFNDMLELVFQNKVSKIFVTYKDRLVRFGFGHFQKIFEIFGTEIVVVNATKEEDFQQELTEDLISIIHHFSMKMYSNRRKILNQLKKDLNENNQTTISD